MDIVFFLALSAGFAALAYLFTKNLVRARISGRIYAKSHLYSRAESPISFWISVGVSTLMAALSGFACAALIVLAIYNTAFRL